MFFWEKESVNKEYNPFGQLNKTQIEFLQDSIRRGGKIGNAMLYDADVSEMVDVTPEIKQLGEIK